MQYYSIKSSLLHLQVQQKSLEHLVISWATEIYAQHCKQLEWDICISLFVSCVITSNARSAVSQLDICRARCKTIPKAHRKYHIKLCRNITLWSNLKYIFNQYFSELNHDTIFIYTINDYLSVLSLYLVPQAMNHLEILIFCL